MIPEQKHNHRYSYYYYHYYHYCYSFIVLFLWWCGAGCSVSSHLQGAAHPVSAGCFCEEDSFQSWRGGVAGGSTWWLERRCQGVGLYPSSGTGPQSLASDWPAGSAPPPGVCGGRNDLKRIYVFMCLKMLFLNSKIKYLFARKCSSQLLGQQIISKLFILSSF